ncbi:sarcinarray family protein [Methanosarcina spelaei]|uniref:Sarcinarray family protein n=1 Tax=Methanosarcina spelaei TaxID=1036679 RepID=A0A2A2HUP6_9EURY|nr:sarcinarray family MAST domain-containing protein [Methanosarcina spelaei]PAV13016.1 sarcinarray family protein [Methanosarcina spelaei]
MKTGILILGLLLLSLIDIVSASSPYGSIDVYYNDKILPGDEIAKPVLKIGEPFKVKIVMTLNQTSRLFIEIDSIGSDSPYEVIEGPSKFAEKKHFESLDPGVYTFEWVLKPTKESADWSMPLNFWYQIHEKGEDEPAARGEFTVAYPHISNEYYEGEIPTSKQPASENKSTQEQPSSENSSSSASAPAFSLITAISALVLVFLRFSRQ